MIDLALNHPPYSVSDVLPYGRRLSGFDIVDDPVKMLPGLVHQDHGMEPFKKQHLLTMLNSPEFFNHNLAGAAGVAITKALTSYTQMSKPARALLSLAGFGIGNIIYNTLHENKLTSYNPDTGISRIHI